MLPISLLGTSRADAAPAGSLLLPTEGGEDVVQLHFDDQVKLAVRLDDSHQRAFLGLNVDSKHQPHLVITDWTMRVDPDSAYNSYNGTPQSGDAFIFGNDPTIGIVISLDHSTAYVTSDGRRLPQPNFGNVNYVGFRAWAVGIIVEERFVELARYDARTDADG